MQDFANKVAVITGAGAGIGRGLAQECSRAGMRLVLADIDAAGLEETAQLLEGTPPLSIPTDVSRSEQVQQLAEAAYDRFGEVHLLFNNAGVLVDGNCWERSLEDWRWIIDVNLWGVIHGIHFFVPRMLAQQSPAHLVNTSSLAGLILGPHLAPYSATKHAVVAITESLYHELAAIGAALKVSLLCPGEVATGIWSSERNRPPRYGESTALGSAAEQQFHSQVSDMTAAGMDAQQLARFVLEGVRAERFWLFPHPDFLQLYQQRCAALCAQQNPHPPHPLASAE